MQKSGAAKVCFLLLALLLVTEYSAATYRKPPFNGSIFGKRTGNAVADYENAAKAMASMCEIATEACQAWFPQAREESN